MNAISEKRVRVTIDNGIAEVALCRPDRLNALDRPMMDGMLDAIRMLRDDASVRAVVLHGEGRAFCAGMDIGSDKGKFGKRNVLEDMGLNPLSARTHGIANRAQQLAWGWRELPVPVIAAVHGATLGGGLQIALGADLRLVTPDVQMSVMEIRWGCVPDMAAFALFKGLVRQDAARDLVFTGRIVHGEEAVKLGLASKVCADPLTEARAIARQIAYRNPDAVQAAKRLLALVYAGGEAEALLAESVEQQQLIGSPNQIEAVRAELEKRVPQFK